MQAWPNKCWTSLGCTPPFEQEGRWGRSGNALHSPQSSPGRRRAPHPEHKLMVTHVLQPYCNRASTHWYTMDKATPPDHRKPPKQAQFPDAQGRASMCASKLVAGAGVSGSSPLVGSLFFCGFAGKTPKDKETSTPRVRLTYCNPPKKQFVAGGRAEGGAIFCVVT